MHSGFHLRAVVAAGASAPPRDGGDRTFLAPFWGRAGGGGVAGQSPPPLLREPDAFQPLPRGTEQKMVSSRSCKWKPGGVSSAAPGFGDFPLAGAAVEAAGCGAPASFGSAAKRKGDGCWQLGDGGETPPGGLLCSPWCSEGPEMGAVAAVQEGISACFVVEGGGELELDLG